MKLQLFEKLYILGSISGFCPKAIFETVPTFQNYELMVNFGNKNSFEKLYEVTIITGQMKSSSAEQPVFGIQINV